MHRIQLKLFLIRRKFLALNIYSVERPKTTVLSNHLKEVQKKKKKTELQNRINNKVKVRDGSSKKQESSRKTSISALLTMPKPLTVWKILKEMEYTRPPDVPLEKPICRSGSNS